MSKKKASSKNVLCVNDLCIDLESTSLADGALTVVEAMKVQKDLNKLISTPQPLFSQSIKKAREQQKITESAADRYDDLRKRSNKAKHPNKTKSKSERTPSRKR